MRRRRHSLRELFALIGLYLLLNGTAAVPLAHAFRYDAEPARVQRTISTTHHHRPRHGPVPKGTPAVTGQDPAHGAYGPESFRDILLIPVEHPEIHGPQLRPGVSLAFRAPVAQRGRGSQPSAMPQGP